ncbi:PAX-interacting protein 1-like isoform X2 [Ostrea edulis]|uniref:PAX-interacting protein 1-like isoform X2 n=1 Tax=Ostrea edulis TaxID=37623 RepID=UPI002094834D|nr:PAX-interacting protein 1-like isoform X2 [Ostrea edulis]
MASQESDEPLFKDVTYYIVGDIDSEVIDLLNDGGAKKDSYLSEMVSHVIADDCTQSEYSEAKELFELPVVTSDWVRLSVTCKKQLDLTLFSPDEVIFSGVIACCSQLKPDDTNALWAMLTAKGGRCRQTLDKQCTHLITGDKHGAKYEEAIKHGGAIKIVCPDWVTDSLEKKERQDEALYHPNLLKSPTDSATPPSTPPPTVRSSPSEPTPMDIEQQEEHAKQQAKLKLKAQALQQHGRIHQKQEVAVSRTPANQGTRPRQKSPGRPPQSHMSRSPAAMPPIPHMQIPPLGLPSFLPPEMQRMGMQRPLRNITNKADQPQSIPGMMLSPNKMNQRMPFNAAIPPGHRPPPPRYVPPPMGQSRPPISMPTTYWGHDPSDNLPPEMCLLGCVFYITDYLKIVGQPQIDNWKKVIEQHGGQVDPAYSNRVTHLLCATQHTDVFHIALKDQRRVVTAFWLNDVLVKKKMLPPWQALHLPIIYGETKPCNNQILCVTNFDGEERLRIKQMINAIGAKYTGYMTHGNSAIICGRSDGKKYDKANEWKIPVVNVQWLSDLVLGHLEALKLPVSPKYRFLGHENQFNLDLSKVLHLMVGWQVPLKIQKETWKKFMPNQKARQAQQSQENELHKDISEPAVKKQKLSIEDPTILQNATQPVIIFTGFPKGQVKKFQMIVSQLGGLSTENPRLCTHLVAPSLSRTMKFFIAINVCQHIVTQEWIEACMAQGTFVDETPYKLRDAATEKAMGCVLDDSLMRAQTKKLFEGMSFYISPSVSPPLSDLKKIVEAAGGKVLKQRPNLLTFTEHKDENGNMKTVMITCENDVMLYKDLIAKDIAIYNAEFILTGVMRQTVDFKVFQIDVH